MVAFVRPALAKLFQRQASSATAMGVLLNTRGLVELVVLNIGLDLGLLSPVLFSMMVLMAVATTFATSPLLSLLGYRPRPAMLRRTS
jgi:Kef-type K+ transport system membrane component KefB